jgi:hypothetical protein
METGLSWGGLNTLHKQVSAAIDQITTTDLGISEFYEKWWSGASHGQVKVEPVKQNLHDPIKVKVLELDGSVVFSNGYKLYSAAAGEYIRISESHANIIRRESWANPSWNWWQSSQPFNYPKQNLIRLYLPTPVPGQNISTLLLQETFTKNNLPVTLKWRRAQGAFSDNTVIWIESTSLKTVLGYLEDLLGHANFIQAPPPLAFNFRGIGIADHPKDGSSLGWMFTELMWPIVKAGESNLLANAFERRGLDLHRPWLFNIETPNNRWDETLE